MIEKKIEELIKESKAKSDRTIQQHIQDLKNQLNLLYDRYPFAIENKRLLEIAVELHDYGKINFKFQKKLKNNKTDDIIHHSILSPFFLIYLYQNHLTMQELLTITYAILNHHKVFRNNYLDFGKTIEIKKKINHYYNFMFPKEIKQVFETDGYDKLYKEAIRISNILRSPNWWEDEKIAQTVKLTGMLIKIDHSASASVYTDIEAEPVKQDRLSLFYRYLESRGHKPSLKEFQAKYKDYENLVLVADTGMGKTGLSVLWSKPERKLFYILPNRTSANGIYQTLTQIYGKENTGLLHSNSLSYLINQEDHIDISTTAILSKPVIVATADQIFTAVYKYPTFEKIYATLSYSDIVIDEVQAFEPSQIVPMLMQMKETIPLGARYLIITATLPEIVKEKIKEYKIPVKIVENDGIDTTKRHKVKIEDKTIEEDLDKIIYKSEKGKSVLVIVNTVSFAQYLYDVLKQKTDRVNLLHSRFTYKDRREKEEEIKNKQEGDIWITTQIVEVSLDIDFDCLFTQSAPIDSLIQRMGRVYRHRKNDYTEKEHNVFIYSKHSNRDIYDDDIKQISIEKLKNTLDSQDFLLSDKKRELVKNIYSDTRIKTNLENEWKKIENLIQNGHILELLVKNKKEAQKLFRDTLTIEVVYHKQEVMEALTQAKNLKGKEKLRKLAEINDYKIPVSVFLVKSFNYLDKDYGIIHIEKAKYSKEKGLTITDEIKEEDIFL